jgi:WD40 repeat protein
MLLFTPDGQSILFYENKQLVFRDVISGNINHQIDVSRYNLDMFHVTLSSDASKLLLMPAPQLPRLIDVVTGAELQTYEHPHGWVICGEFSQDQKHIFIGGPYKEVHQWNIQTHTIVQRYGHDMGFLELAISRDNHYLVSGGGWSETGIWDVVSGKQLHRIRTKAYLSQIGTILILPDDQHALVCEGTGGLIVHLQSGHIVQELDTSDDACIVCAAVSDQTGYLITNARSDVTDAQIWDTQTWKRIATLEHDRTRQNDFPRLVDISADGSHAAVVGDDDKLSVWDLASKKVIHQYQWHDYFIYGA